MSWPTRSLRPQLATTTAPATSRSPCCAAWNASRKPQAEIEAGAQPGPHGVRGAVGSELLSGESAISSSCAADSQHHHRHCAGLRAGRPVRRSARAAGQRPRADPLLRIIAGWIHAPERASAERPLAAFRAGRRAAGRLLLPQPARKRAGAPAAHARTTRRMRARPITWAISGTRTGVTRRPSPAGNAPRLDRQLPHRDSATWAWLTSTSSVTQSAPGGLRDGLPAEPGRRARVFRARPAV